MCTLLYQWQYTLHVHRQLKFQHQARARAKVKMSRLTVADATLCCARIHFQFSFLVVHAVTFVRCSTYLVSVEFS